MMPKNKLVAYAVSLLVVMNQLSGCSTLEKSTENRASTPPPKFEPFIRLDDNAFRFVGSLRRPTGKVLGSAVLIEPNVALTAAHCLIDSDIAFIEFAGKPYQIDYTLCYEEGSYKNHDIGLVFLKEDVVGFNPVTRIDDVLSSVNKWDYVTTIGYSRGFKKASSLSTFRYYGVLYNEENQIKMLPYAGSIWFGDSGGGLFWFGPEGFQLIGIIVSFSKIDGTIVENSSTRVDCYEEWIDSEIEKNNILNS
ncbi:MAG: hypothetical protein CMP84_05900 [Gammaproteobacteria bacterium]|nr:hypothetical protein [Gammaproteobacteria bacterium]